MSYLALDIGGSAIKYALADEACRLTRKGKLPNGFDTHEGFIEAIDSIFDSFADIDGIAISTCGELDPTTGEMFSGGTLGFNAGTNLIRAVQARCGVPVSLENDANCALIAEMTDGALADCRNGVVLVLGSAVGGAVMIDREPYYGSHFHSGNVSFLLNNIADPRTPILAQTNGVGGLVEDYMDLSGPTPVSFSPEQVFAKVEQGDPMACAALDRYCARLGAVVFNLQLVLDVEVIAIGGGVSSQGSLVDSLTQMTARLFEAAPAPLPPPVIRACRHHNDANLIGAVRHHLGSAGASKFAPAGG